MKTLSEYIAEQRAIEAKATQGPWVYNGNDSVDYECAECGEAFPESGYAIKSIDKYQVLECHLYGMETLCIPNVNFIIEARNNFAKLLSALEKAVEQRDFYIRDARDERDQILAKNTDNVEIMELLK